MVVGGACNCKSGGEPPHSKTAKMQKWCGYGAAVLRPYEDKRNPRTGLKTGHYKGKPKRKAAGPPPENGGPITSKKSQEHSQE